MLQANYRYNALGQQVVRELTQSGEVIHAVHDPEGNRIAEYLYDDTTGASTLIRQYIWMEDRPVAVVEGGQIYFIRTDHIGCPVFATNDLGVKVWEASYLPFGEVRVSAGAPIDLRFPGQRFQMESRLHQNWMRDYDPTTGRYLQADPASVELGAGGLVGSQDWMKAALIAMGMRYATFDGGGEALAGLLGSAIQVHTGDMAEMAAHMDGSLRNLASMSVERLPAPYADVPTAKEQGHDVVGPIMRSYYLGRNVDQAGYDKWVEMFRAAYADPNTWADLVYVRWVMTRPSSRFTTLRGSRS